MIEKEVFKVVRRMPFSGKLVSAMAGILPPEYIVEYRRGVPVRTLSTRLFACSTLDDAVHYADSHCEGGNLALEVWKATALVSVAQPGRCVAIFGGQIQSEHIGKFWNCVARNESYDDDLLLRENITGTILCYEITLESQQYSIGGWL